MRLLAYQDIWKLTVALLREWAHDVVTAIEIGMARAADEDLLKQAKADNRLLITRDKEYGSLVFLGNTASLGVILLRITPETMDDVHPEFSRLLSNYAEDELQGYFCTVESGRHRIRRLPSD